MEGWEILEDQILPSHIINIILTFLDFVTNIVQNTEDTVVRKGSPVPPSVSRRAFTKIQTM